MTPKNGRICAIAGLVLIVLLMMVARDFHVVAALTCPPTLMIALMAFVAFIASFQMEQRQDR